MAGSYIRSYINNKARLTWKMGYLTILHVRLGAKIGDLRAKDSSAFCKRLIPVTLENYSGWLGESNRNNSELA